MNYFRKTFKVSHIPIIIYLALNVSLIVGFVFLFDQYVLENEYAIWLKIAVGIVLYAFSALLAFSPFGEWLLCKQIRCKKIKDEHTINLIMPIFNEVYEKAIKEDPKLQKNIKLYIINDISVNACAAGRKTIGVTQGLLYESPEIIKAVLAHEFGHLSHKDTHLTLLVTVGNMIVILLVYIIAFSIFFLSIILCLFGKKGMAVGELLVSLSFLTSSFFLRLWSWVGVLLVMKSSRENEFEADKFSAKLGFGEALCEFFARNLVKTKIGIFAALSRSHPKNELRIARIREFLDNSNKDESNLEAICDS